MKKFFSIVKENPEYLGFFAIAAFYLYGLDAPLLWSDEANTANFARNILQSGLPTAFDGQNLIMYDNCFELSKDLLLKRIPWLPYYLGAASIWLFGDTTEGVRLLYALSAALASIPFFLAFRGACRHSWVWVTVAFLSPQVLLLHRNVRYYSMCTLLFGLVAWVVLKRNQQGKTSGILLGILFMLFYHTHPLMAGCTSAAIVLYALFFHRRATLPYIGASLSGVAAWAVWYFSLDGLLETRTATHALKAWHQDVYWPFLAKSIWNHFTDLDLVSGFPLLGIAVLGFMDEVKNRRPWSRYIWFILLAWFSHVFFVSALAGAEGQALFGMIRFLPHIILIGPILVGLLVSRLTDKRALAVPLFFVIVGFNVANIRYWVPSQGRPVVPLSWWPIVYENIYTQVKDPWRPVIRQLSSLPQTEGHQLLSVFPPFASDILIFYLGDRFSFKPDMKPGSSCMDATEKIVGSHKIQEWQKTPEWLLVFGGFLNQPPNFTVEGRFAFPPKTPEGSRPELTAWWRTQPPRAQMYLYKESAQKL